MLFLSYSFVILHVCDCKNRVRCRLILCFCFFDGYFSFFFSTSVVYRIFLLKKGKKVIFWEFNSVSDTFVCNSKLAKKKHENFICLFGKWNQKVGHHIESVRKIMGDKVSVRVRVRVKTFAHIARTPIYARQSVQCQKVHSVWMKCAIVCDVCWFKRVRAYTMCEPCSIESALINRLQ